MAKSDSERIYQSQKKIYKRIPILLRRDTDAEIIEWLAREDTPTPATMLREAVRREIESE